MDNSRDFVDNLSLVHHQHMRRFQTRTDLGLHHEGMDTAVFGDLFGGLVDLLLRGSSFQGNQPSAFVQQRQRPSG